MPYFTLLHSSHIPILQATMHKRREQTVFIDCMPCPTTFFVMKAEKPVVIILIVFIVYVFSVRKADVSPSKEIPKNYTCRSNRSLDYDFLCIAVIVEFRAVHQLVAVVHNVNYHIPSTWPIQIFHGKDNEHFIRNSTLAPLIGSNKIILMLMNGTYNKSRTSELLTDPCFWRSVRGEKILFFQIDSIMCSNSPHRVTDYLHYDYVGAPWSDEAVPAIFDKQYHVGNGGFSIRTRSKVLALLALVKYDPNLPEDVWYAHNMHLVNGSIASIEVAKTFAVESIYYERPVGIHRTILSCAMQEKLYATCPESILVMTGECQ